MDIPAKSMGAVRQALESLRLLSSPPWKDDRHIVLVDREGKVYLDIPGGIQSVKLQIAPGELIDLIAPFKTVEGSRGPDLHRPRKDIRIVPAKLSGSPHVVGTRVETRALAGLARDGYDDGSIAALYLYFDRNQIAQALDLEEQLNKNLSVGVAA